MGTPGAPSTVLSSATLLRAVAEIPTQRTAGHPLGKVWNIEVTRQLQFSQRPCLPGETRRQRPHLQCGRDRGTQLVPVPQPHEHQTSSHKLPGPHLPHTANVGEGGPLPCRTAARSTAARGHRPASPKVHRRHLNRSFGRTEGPSPGQAPALLRDSVSLHHNRPGLIQSQGRHH